MRMRSVEKLCSNKLWFSNWKIFKGLPFVFVLRWTRLDEYGSDVVHDLGNYLVEILAVSPESARKSWPDVRKEFSLSVNQWEDSSDDFKAARLIEYGICVLLDDYSGNNSCLLLREARQKLAKYDIRFPKKLNGLCVS